MRPQNLAYMQRHVATTTEDLPLYLKGEPYPYTYPVEGASQRELSSREVLTDTVALETRYHAWILR